MKRDFLAVIGQALNQKEVEESAEKIQEMTKASFWTSIDWSKLLRPLATALIIFVIGYYLIKVLIKFLGKLLRMQKVNEGLVHFLLVALQGILYFILATVIAGNLGLKTTSLVALIGTFGIAIGLALQGSLSDLASGVLLVILQPIRVKDFVYLESVDGLLQVHAIRLFQTVFTNYRGFHIYLPNKQVLSSTIQNLSQEGLVGVQIRVVVDGEEDMDRVLGVAREALKGVDILNHQRPYSIFVDEILDYGIAYIIRGYTRDVDYGTASSEIAMAVKKAFQREGIRLAHPTFRLENPPV